MSSVTRRGSGERKRGGKVGADRDSEKRGKARKDSLSRNWARHVEIGGGKRALLRTTGKEGGRRGKELVAKK